MGVVMERLLILFLYLIGMLWIVMGVLLVFATDMVKKKLYAKLLEKWDFKKLSILPLVFGILLLLSARYNTYVVLIVILGLLGVLKGVLMIVATEVMKKKMDWWLKANDTFCKIWGVVIIIIGSFVLVGI